MLGAIIGDMVGSPYEMPYENIKTENFPLFSAQSRFTDDTVMTIAIAEGVMLGHGDAAATREAVIDAMHKYGRLFPLAGYGARFIEWLREESREPYGSYGNGSAMRVSPVAWAYDDLETVTRYACITAEVTHNHPEGIKGACAVAAAVFLARTGNTRNTINSFISSEYGYDLSYSLENLHQKYIHDESCQNSVPQAITVFLHSRDFEDALRKAVSLGGDSDTIAAMAGSIAHAYCGRVPEHIVSEAMSRLHPRLQKAVQTWDAWLKSKGEAANTAAPFTKKTG